MSRSLPLLIALALTISAEPNTQETAMSMITALKSQTEQAAFEEIADASGLTLRNPDLRQRKTAKIRLPNGLEAYLISDPGADQSSASVAVHAGSWNDPEEFPGMAHFCEHMLFMGTDKYPDCNAFFTRVADFGGTMNAFTASDRTVYMFSSKVEGFPEILDRFAHFFIDPLFDPNHIARELHAVDQEFSKNLEHDGWRQYMIFKEMSNAGHPNQKFSTGNSATLGHIPASALRDWHRDHYGAGRMHLFIYSSLPIETLKEQAAACFSAVPAVEKDTSIPYAPIFSAEQKGHITYIKPIQNRQTLSLSWELPAELSDEPSKSADLIAYVLNRGQKNSLYELLKKEQWIDGMSVRSEELGMKQNGSISITLELSPQGLAHEREVIQHCFEALAGLKSSGIPLYLHEEKNEIATLSYEYQSRQDAFQMAQEIGRALPDEPLATFPKEQVIAAQYNPETVQAILSLLTPEQCAIVLAASPEMTGVAPERNEKWFRAEYTVRPIAPDWLAAWNEAAPNARIVLAEPNPFIPKQLSRVEEEQGVLPSLVSETESGIAYYCRAPEFAAPESAIQLYIRTPELQPTSKSSVLASLYLNHLTDDLRPIISAAQSAGLTARFDADKMKLRIQIYGFSEKAPLLLNEILKNLTLAPPSQEQFETLVARHAKVFSNGAKELPLRQAKEFTDSLLLRERSTQTEKLAALKTITYEDYLDFHNRLFDQTYAEGFFAGNLTFKEAESSWIDVQHVLSKGVYPASSHLRSKVLELPSQGGPFALQKTTESQGNAVLLAIDEGSFTFERRSAQDILAPALKDAFFNELRTKQKTAYMATAEPTELEERLFHFLMVQSNSHQPEDLLYRFELFLEEYVHSLAENITPARFETLKASSIHSLKTRYRNLSDKAALWTLLAFEKGGDFNYIEKRIASLQSLTYERFSELTRGMLSRANSKRLAVLFEGRLNTPFSYESIDAARLLELGRYVAKEERPLIQTLEK